MDESQGQYVENTVPTRFFKTCFLLSKCQDLSISFAARCN